jgi:hypothetical protein
MRSAQKDQPDRGAEGIPTKEQNHRRTTGPACLQPLIVAHRDRGDGVKLRADGQARGPTGGRQQDREDKPGCNAWANREPNMIRE